ncbi:MAG: DUF6443 domain-containing protein [Bacteroidota bacterium]
MKKLFFVVLLLLPFGFMLAQPTASDLDPSLSVLPPSPSASALVKYVDFPVSYSSGTPQISIPIHTITGRGLSLPISLSYHAGGVRVDDVSSVVGLGWSLQAGGAVTRTVVGKADERPDGFLQRGAQLPYPINLSSNFTDLQQFAEGHWDGQPDVFSFNFGPYSGKFYIDPSNTIRLIPHQDLAISYSLCTSCSYPLSGSIISFTIKTPDGLVYTFGTSAAVEYSETSSYSTIGGNAGCNARSFDVPVATAWYLKEVFNPKTQDHLYLNYTPKNITYDLSYTESFTMPLPEVPLSGCNGNFSRTACVTTKTDNGVILSSIESSYSRVDFITGTQRSDIGGTGSGGTSRLQEIHLKGENGGILKKFKLIQSFVTSSGTTPSTKPDSDKRMYLDKVEEFSATDAFINRYSFAYFNRDQLPPRLSFEQDHWGYYNGQSNSQSTPFASEDFNLLDRVQDRFSSFSPANRQADGVKASYGTLNEVTYPTGGTAQFDYEGNEVGICDSIKTKVPATHSTYARYTTSRGEHTNMDTFTVDFAQEVSVRYFVRQIGHRTNGAQARLVRMSNNQELFRVGGDGLHFTPDTIGGSTRLWLTAGSYRIEATVRRGPDYGLNPPFDYNEPEESSIIVNLREEQVDWITNEPVGGIRVQQVTYDDGDSDSSNHIIRKYVYRKLNSGGCNRSTAILLGRYPQYMAMDLSVVSDFECHLRQCRFIRLGSSSIVGLTNKAGQVVNYEQVWELHGANGENGKKYMRYQIFKDSNSELGPNALATMVNSPTIDRSYLSGKLIEEKVYNASGDVLSQRLWDYEFYELVNQNKLKGIFVKKLYDPPCFQNAFFECDGINEEGEEYFYYVNDCDGIGVSVSTISGLPVLRLKNCSPTYGPCYNQPAGTIINNLSAIDQYSIEWYDQVSQWVYLKSDTSRLYDADGSGNYVETVTDYGYDLPQGRHSFPTETSTVNSDGLVDKNTTIFTPEVNTPLANDLVSNWHMIVPLETRREVNNEWVDGMQYNYSYFTSSGVPSSSVTSTRPPQLHQVARREISWDSNGNRVDDGWINRATINLYDPFVWMPEQVTQLGWSPETYTWNNGLVVRRQYENFSWEYEYFPNSRLLKRMTEVDGQQTLYTYDDAQRLQSISQSGGNVVTIYAYNYQNGGSSRNYVKTRNAFTPVSGSALHWTESYEYLDGLGRPIQTVQRQHAESQKDVVNALVYDAQGRVTQSYLPYESAYNDGRYITVPPTHDHTLTQYEASPLGRVISSTPPSWYPTTTIYGSNGGNVVNISNGNTYPAGSLVKTIVKDPENLEQTTYTDKKGRKVFSRQRKGSVWLDTYYGYDDKDRLVQVVPPNTTKDSPLTFKYEYDGADNISRKYLPDQNNWSRYVYDERNLMVGSQDPNQALAGRWVVNKYDNYGRLAQSGFYNNPSPPDPQSLVINELLLSHLYDGTACGLSNPNYVGKRCKTSTRILGSNDWLEVHSSYDNFGRLERTSGNHLLNLNAGSEVVDYSYDWGGNITQTSRTHTPSSGPSLTIVEQNRYDHVGRAYQYFHQINGGPLQEISHISYTERDQIKTKQLGKVGSTYLESCDYGYLPNGFLAHINQPDKLGNHVFALQLIYDQSYSGLATTSQKNGNISGMVWKTQGGDRQGYRFGYDNWNRLQTAQHTNLSEQIGGRYDCSYSYDQRGNLLSLNRTGRYHNGLEWETLPIDALTYSYYNNTNRLQTIDDAINNSSCYDNQTISNNLIGDNTIQSRKTLTGTGQVDGSSQTIFRSGDAVTLGRGFEVTSSGSGAFVANLDGCVSENPQVSGFIDRNTGQSYTYDANGNLTYDPNKNLKIGYNYLNLPKQIVDDNHTPSDPTDDQVITITYDASGQKLSKQVQNSQTVLLEQHYCQGIEYKDKQVEAIYHSEGRAYNKNVEKTNAPSPDWRYEYNLTDHLGNLRVSFYEESGVAKVLQENHYYPFGMLMQGDWRGEQVNNYGYNGKELNDDFNLNWLDYGARWYDASVGRWNSFDALAEHPNQIDKSPFAYAWNNPTNLNDPDGNCPKCFLQGIWRGAKNTVTGLVHVVTHPVETAEALGNAVMHPIETGSAIIGAVSARIDEAANAEGGYYELAGEIVFEVGTAAFATSKVAKVGKIGDGVEFTADLRKTKAKSRSGHRNAGNKQLNDAMKNDPNLRKKMEKRLGNDVFDRTSTSGKGRKNPEGYEWDHNTHNKNKLDLRSKENHKKKTAKDPGRVGGYAKYWKDKKSK